MRNLTLICAFFALSTFACNITEENKCNETSSTFNSSSEDNENTNNDSSNEEDSSSEDETDGEDSSSDGTETNASNGTSSEDGVGIYSYGSCNKVSDCKPYSFGSVTCVMYPYIPGGDPSSLCTVNCMSDDDCPAMLDVEVVITCNESGRCAPNCSDIIGCPPGMICVEDINECQWP